MEIAVPTRPRLIFAATWAAPLLLQALGCSSREPSAAKPANAGSADPGGSTSSAAPPKANAQASFAVEPCSPEAEAAFKRLSSGQASDLRPSHVAKDVALLTTCCNAGSAAVCNGLGVVYGEGHGVEADAAKAIGFFSRACDGGVAMGCFNAAGLYDSGAGIPKDEPQAARFFERACELGNVFACEGAAVAHASGHGVPKSFSKAAVFYEKACDGGWSPGCTNIGALYEAGAGVDKDLQKAKAYYAKGCELESAESCKAAKRLSTK